MLSCMSGNLDMAKYVLEELHQPIDVSDNVIYLCTIIYMQY